MLCPKVSLELVKAFRSLGTKEEEGNFLPNHILKHWFILGLCLYSIARNSSRGVFQVRIQPGDTHSSHSDCDFCSKSVQCGRTLVPSLIHIRFSSLALKAAQGSTRDHDEVRPGYQECPIFQFPLVKHTNKFFFPFTFNISRKHKSCNASNNRHLQIWQAGMISLDNLEFSKWRTRHLAITKIQLAQ